MLIEIPCNFCEKMVKSKHNIMKVIFRGERQLVDSEKKHEKTESDSFKICAGSGAESGVFCEDASRGLMYTFSDENDSDIEKVRGVCMPSPCALGCSFDRELMYKVGRAVGSLAASFGVNAVLSPDVGIVRSPLYGGLADRFGEDPYLCGALGAEWVKGAQSAGVAAVLSHFGDGSQSGGKYTCDHKIDRRALHELYIRPFEMTVRLAAPKAVYCGMSKINGLYSGENYVLLTEILRRKWGFQGAVLADMRLLDPVEAMACGVDMSYPAGSAEMRRKLKCAVEDGNLPDYYPAQSAGRVKTLTAVSQRDEESPDVEECCRLARKAAERSAVLLKNHKQTLPLPLSGNIALIGRQAKYPRVQRGGKDALLMEEDSVKGLPEVFEENQVRFRYCDGYDEHNKTDDALLKEAVKCAAKAEFAVVFVGFDDYYDNNCADRFTNQLPKAQTRLIQAVARANANTVVVVGGSALPKMNWIGKVKSVLYLPLGGGEISAALFRLLFGLSNPAGRLSVSYSLNEGDLACGDTFGRDERVSEHRESIYVGYRYFNKANLFAVFPFGYGLSYTKFEYSHMRASRANDGWRITLDVRNVGKRDGAEVVQLYVEAPKGDKFRPVRELKQFERIYLVKGEKTTVTMWLPDASFERYFPEEDRFDTVAGRYRVCAGASSADIRTEVWISMSGRPAVSGDCPNWYVRPAGRPGEQDFQRLYDEDGSMAVYRTAVYSDDSTLNELCGIGVFRFAVRRIRRIAERRIGTTDRRDPVYAERLDGILNMPVRRLSGVCHGLYPMKLTRWLIRRANRRGGNGI